MLALGTVLWAVAGAGFAVADDATGSGCGCNCGCDLPFCCDPVPRDPWYVTTDGIAMQRLFRGLGPVATMGLGSTGSIALSQQDLTEPFQGGAQLLVGHTFGESRYQIKGLVLRAFHLGHICPDERPDRQLVLAVHELRRPPSQQR